VLPEGATAVHRTLAVDYLRPAALGPLRGVGRALEPSERAIACEGELFDASGQLVARGRAELRIMDRAGGLRPSG
jgi:acyl-coenzyme A thioesterase PaaI-like protein